MGNCAALQRSIVRQKRPIMRQIVWLASCITSVDVHHTDTVSVTQLESLAQVSTITIENQLHFFKYFDDIN